MESCIAGHILDCGINCSRKLGVCLNNCAAALWPSCFYEFRYSPAIDAEDIGVVELLLLREDVTTYVEYGSTDSALTLDLSLIRNILEKSTYS